MAARGQRIQGRESTDRVAAPLHGLIMQGWIRRRDEAIVSLRPARAHFRGHSVQFFLGLPQLSS